jgi:hypothetical protein
LTVAYRASGILPQQLQEEPELSGMLVYLWEWFIELHKARAGNGFGMNPISWAEFYSWQSMTGNRLRRWELLALRAMDNAALSTVSKK